VNLNDFFILPLKMAPNVTCKRASVLAGVIALLAAGVNTGMAFVPPSVKAPAILNPTAKSASTFVASSRSRLPSFKARQTTTTALRMAAEDFDESKYTEASWAAIAALTKVAEYYEASNVEAPLLLDFFLNPSKHGGSDSAQSAMRVVDRILSSAGVDTKAIRSDLEKYLAKQPKISDKNAQKVMGRTLQKVLDTARSTKSVLGDSYVSTEGLLLALCKEDASFTRDALAKQNISYDDILKAVKKFREKSGPAISRGAENNYDALLKYGIDFTERAKEGKLDPVIGRDDEIRRAIQILSRRTKNNPVLIGDPGVGKVSPVAR
jgi:ATP-dependent Clp protease ATP-binding subunit ClpB